MNHTELIPAWKAEEEIAYIHGWDFSHISGRYTEQDDLPVGLPGGNPTGTVPGNENSGYRYRWRRVSVVFESSP